MIIGDRQPFQEGAFEDAIYRAPNVWAHARTMKMFQKMNVMDQTTFQMLTQTFGQQSWDSMRWIGSLPLSVAAVLNHDHPEVFQDTTGRTMEKFLKRNPQYQIPQEHQRKKFFQ